MRPRYLEIEGLQSFKEMQKIDFDKLGETGLFGIFGPTGSGKSTVLDAITLALYGSVARAKNNTQGIINTDSQTVRVAFTFDLLKDHVRKTYRVERVYKKKKDVENAAEARMAKLIEVSEAGEIPLSDKSGDVTNQIISLIGLRLDDFTRSVVLPQNKFQEFLLSAKAEKRAMLERIFYLEEYGRLLSDKVSRKISEGKINISGVMGAMSQLGDASEGALAESESQMTLAQGSRDQCKEDLLQKEMRYNEGKECWELISEIEIFASREKEHLKHQKQIDEKRLQLENAIKVQAIAGIIESYREAALKHQVTNEELALLHVELPTRESDSLKANENLEGHKKRSEVEKPQLIERKARLCEARNIHAELEMLENEIIALREGFKKTKLELTVKNQEIEEKKTSIIKTDELMQSIKAEIEKRKTDPNEKKEIQTGVKLQDELEYIASERESTKNKHIRLKEKVSALHEVFKQHQNKVEIAKEKQKTLLKELEEAEKEIPADKKEVMKEIESDPVMISIFERMIIKKQDVILLQKRMSELDILVTTMKETIGTLEEQKALAKNRLEKAKIQMEKVSGELQKNQAGVMAKALQEGQACPVCGSDSHPRPAHMHGTSDIQEIIERVDNAKETVQKEEQEVRNAEVKVIQGEEEQKGTQLQIEHAQQEILLRKKELLELQKELPAEYQNKEIHEGYEEMRQRKNRNAKLLEAIDAWETRISLIKKNIEIGLAAISDELISEKAVQIELQVNQESLITLEKSLGDIDQIYQEKELLYNEFIKKMKISSAKGRIDEIHENEERIQAFLKEIAQLEETITNIRANIEAKSIDIQALVSKCATIEENGRNSADRKREKEQKILELSEGKEIEEEIVIIDQKVSWINDTEKVLFEEARILQEQITTLKTRRSTLQNQKEIYQQAMQNEQKKIQQTLIEKGMTSIEEAEKAMMPIPMQKELDQEIKEYEKVASHYEMQKNIRLEKLKGRMVTMEEVHHMESAFNEAKENYERAIERFESAKNSFYNIKKNVDTWTKLDGMMKEYSKKADLLVEIQKLLKGNAFIEYIAEERLRYIAKEASETLGVLTKFRYVLELDAENGFIIRDQANGGSHRLVSSLSGGETFLTSLSLALALSKQIQLKGQSPLEFFFLDEGFGTLDATLLDSVIDSLERLSSKERIIGLISHVPELKNRISRRLIITPPTLEGKGSVAYIEKA